MRLFIIYCCCCFTFSVASAQNRDRLGALPTININKKLGNQWKVNFKTEARQTFSEGLFAERDTYTYQYVHTDLSLLAATKIGLNNGLAFGYLARIKDDGFAYRFIQQFTITRRVAGYRLAHRFVSDWTFDQEEDMELRLRYRVSLELPLSGQDVDPKECYLKVNNEYLNGFQGGEYDLETRIIPLLGYLITDSNKVELGVDFRVDGFVDENTRNRFWVAINWFVVL